ncbi:MAG: hypothetical protein E7311_06420 [Clostridiales bacterium]|nr:hypothetical protein [Clostridiales bacterium]
MKKIIIPIVIIIGVMIILCGIIMAGEAKKIINENKEVTMQIIQYDNSDNTEKVVKEIQIKTDDFIELDKYDGNNIKILEITDEYVKVSREKTRYNIINDLYMEFEPYIENLVEEIEYNIVTPCNIDDPHPLMEYAQARYYYSLKFVR